MPKSLINDRFGRELNIVVIGPPFGFKGQLGKFLSQTYGVCDDGNKNKEGFHIVTVGDEIKEEIKTNPQMAKLVADGELIDNQTAHALAMRRYDHGKKQGFHRSYFDGHCREADQVDLLVNSGILGEHSLCFVFEVSRKSCFERLAYALKHGDRANRLDNDKLEKRLGTYEDNLPGVLQSLMDHRIDHEHIDAEGELNDFKERFLKNLTRFCPLPKAPHQEQVKRPQWVYGEPQTPMFA